MRLTLEQARIIGQAVHQVFGEGTDEELFGSRMHDGKRGDDIDLYVEPEDGVEDVLDREHAFHAADQRQACLMLIESPTRFVDRQHRSRRGGIQLDFADECPGPARARIINIQNAPAYIDLLLANAARLVMRFQIQYRIVQTFATSPPDIKAALRIFAQAFPYAQIYFSRPAARVRSDYWNSGNSI